LEEYSIIADEFSKRFENAMIIPPEKLYVPMTI